MRSGSREEHFRLVDRIFYFLGHFENYFQNDLEIEMGTGYTKDGRTDDCRVYGHDNTK